MGRVAFSSFIGGLLLILIGNFIDLLGFPYILDLFEIYAGLFFAISLIILIIIIIIKAILG